MSADTLRAAIETAMRRRDPGVRVSVTPAAGQTLASVDGNSSALVWGSSMAPTEDEALRRLARGFGLRVETCGSCNGRGRHAYGREVEDGCDACECAGVVVVDPAEEVARLTRRLETAVPWEVSSPPTDEELRALFRRWSTGPERYQADCDLLIAAITDLREKCGNLTLERDEARMALRAYAPRCGSCGAPATCRGSYEGDLSSYACDGCCGHGNEDGVCVAVSAEHAAALRAAGGER